MILGSMIERDQKIREALGDNLSLLTALSSISAVMYLLEEEGGCLDCLAILNKAIEDQLDRCKEK